MPTFGQLRQGTAAREPAQLRLVTGEDVRVDLRLLAPLETIGVLSAAAVRARASNTEAEDGQPVYDLAVAAHTLALAAVDPESPEQDPRPFFDSADQMLGSPLLTTDAILHLFEQYEHFVDRMALAPAQLDEAGMRALIESCAEGDLLPFSRLRPGTQWSFVRFLAAAQRSALRAKLPSTSGSESGTAKPNGAPPPAPPAADPGGSPE